MIMDDVDIRSLRAERHDGSFVDPDPDQLAMAALEDDDGILEEIQNANDERGSSSFHRLPHHVIENILYLVDANTFASLVLLNRTWRSVSDSSLLYSYHLSELSSNSMTREVTPDAIGLEDLDSLKRRFLVEISRNTFDVFLRPRKTLIKLISTSMSSSTAFPQGEAFRFAFSASGQMILCISSSRIVVLDVRSEPAVVRHELKTRRRPLDATILDDASLIAVISSRHQVNIYSLSNEEAKHIQTLALNDVPRSLALSPTGGVLAIAYEDMIEVYALGEGALATQRRSVRCFGVETLSFSSDGDMLFGSSIDDQNSSIVTITVPFYTEPEGDSSPRDVQIRMWTTQILFPEIVRGYSHACSLPFHAEGAASWIVVYDEEIATFRAIRANSPNSGTTHFVSPLSSEETQDFTPFIIPTADGKGELVALGFQDYGLWVYGVPDRLDIAPPEISALESDSTSISSQSTLERLNEFARDDFVRLQRVISNPKLLIRGHQVTDMHGITAARWVVHSTNGILNPEPRHRRLVAVAPGGVNPPTIGEEDVPVDGGRVLILDFERTTRNGESIEVNVEIGEAEPKMLKEPSSSLDTEVELERRRTRVQRARTTVPRARAASRESYPGAASNRNKLPPLRARRNSFSLSSSPNNDVDSGDIPPLPDTPYDNTQPRSRDTLHRAATAAAATRPRRSSPNFQANRIHFEPQVPHESDADNWVPPPPPYTREPDAPLPESLRRTLLPQQTVSAQVNGQTSPVRRSQTTRLESRAQDLTSRALPTIQRLNTITGSRLVSRMRRNTRDPESPEQSQGNRNGTPQTRRGSSVHSSLPLGRPSEPNVAQPAHDSLGIFQEPSANIFQTPVQSNPILPLSSATEACIHISPQAAPSPGVLVEPPPGQPLVGPPMQWPVPEPEISNMGPRMNFHSYSISSPNLLHVPEPEYVIPDRVQHNAPRASAQGITEERSHSQDIGRLNPGLRASTDPTLSHSPTPSNEIWRRRIEEWNERTIYERSRKSRRCIVM